MWVCEIDMYLIRTGTHRYSFLYYGYEYIEANLVMDRIILSGIDCTKQFFRNLYTPYELSNLIVSLPTQFYLNTPLSGIT